MNVMTIAITEIIIISPKRLIDGNLSEIRGIAKYRTIRTIATLTANTKNSPNSIKAPFNPFGAG